MVSSETNLSRRPTGIGSHSRGTGATTHRARLESNSQFHRCSHKSTTAAATATTSVVKSTKSFATTAFKSENHNGVQFPLSEIESANNVLVTTEAEQASNACDEHICRIHSETLVACLDKNGVYVCKSFGPRCFVIQKVRHAHLEVCLLVALIDATGLQSPGLFLADSEYWKWNKH